MTKKTDKGMNMDPSTFFAFEALEGDVGPLHGVIKRGFAWICAAVNILKMSKQNCDGYVRGFV